MNDTSELFKDQGYLLGDLLATDSWGELYAATYVGHARDVLFRRFVPALSGERTWKLAAAEIQAWARIDHPGVVQPLDWGAAQAGSYLATAMPEGVPLAALVGEQSGLERLDPGEVFAGLLGAVEAAARWGVLHLGLGLTNVWVAESAVGVSEFGLWYVRSEFPEILAEAGQFEAPEQSAGGRAVAASDTYALGLLYVALHQGLTVARSAASGEFDALGLEPVIARCLAPQPLLRPRTEELSLALGLKAPALEDSFRDCPVCRLKEQIARDRSERRGGLAGRFRDFMMEEDLDGPAPSPPDPARKPEATRPASDTFLALFPWVAIALLALATLAVWWLAFR